MKTVIIAIDGPAGSGKSSTAKEVARRTGALYMDTGAMYRAVALKVIREGYDLSEQGVLDRLLPTLDIRLEEALEGVRVLLDGQDVSSAIRTNDVSTMSSRVSSFPEVRLRMVELQRKTADRETEKGKKVVMEGRDIGTVVFPDAQFKFFVTAAPEVRAKRRAVELRQRGETVDEAHLLQDIKDRDARDAGRKHSPLRQAKDAIVLDTSSMTFEEQVENIIRVIEGNAA
ncbi:MAG: (d)CMP kinase [Bacteroidetes bacterium]|nr:(d)CMP kinase [Bacteroidota bacterium]